MANVLEIAVQANKVLRVGAEEYALSFPLSEVVKLETKLGRSMKSVTDWLRIQTSEVQSVLEAALKHSHSDKAAEVAEVVCTTLDPEQIEHVIDFLCTVACPKAMERLAEEMEKIQERIKKGQPPLPNAQGADAS